MYSPGEYDLAGFAVGAVHRNRILLQSVEVGDILLRLQRSREHSNGDANKNIFETPTKIYLKSCLPLFKISLVKGMAILN
jgi:phosphoribosylamine--glycine ligase / phosphoribosylformylglycinamidine cyclo-ligase